MKEYEVLEQLLRHVDREVSFDELLEVCFGEPRAHRSAETRRRLRARVITTISRLREALGSAAAIIETCDDGYRINLADLPARAESILS